MHSFVRRVSIPLAGLLCALSATPALAQRCGDTITVSTRLQADLYCPAIRNPGYALRVRGPGVVLDLGGYVIDTSGPPTTLPDIGVLLDRARGAAVVNGTIIAASSPNNGRAIEVRDSPGAIIEGIRVLSSTYGVVLRGADDATVANSYFEHQAPFLAIVSDDAPGGPRTNRRLRLLNNEMYNFNAGGGMFVLKGQSISGSVIEGNKGSGIGSAITAWAADARGVRISANTFYANSNAGIGIYLAAVNDSLVDHNVVVGFDFGIFLHQYCCGLAWSAPVFGATGNQISANQLWYNETGVGFGTPRGTGIVPPVPPAYLESNRVAENHIGEAKWAFRFGRDTRNNDATGNAMVNVATVAEDFGVGNQY